MKQRFKIESTIKIRLAFQFMLIVAGILLFFASLVYYFTFNSQREKFRYNLLNRAQNTAIILINRRQVDTALLNKIYRATFAGQDQEIVVSDTNIRKLYSYNANLLNRKELRKLLKSDVYGFFSLRAKDGIYYRFPYKKKIAVIFILAYDKVRSDYLAEFRQILFWSIIFSLWVSVLLSYIFSRKALRPVTNIIENVKAINSANLNKRLDEGKRKDELEQLAMTFNEMLGSLEIAFRNQEDFVSHASHELRTPLAVMIAESDYFLVKDHNLVEYKEHISVLITDLKKLNAQLNSLLHLAQSNRVNSILFSPVRLDEVIFDSIQQVKNNYPLRKIITKIQFPENEHELIISCNPGLLVIAFKNIIENACKFSDEDVTVELLLLEKHKKVIISDKGIGIPIPELTDIFKPFRRASNVKYKSGFGIGLTLVAKILELHEATIEVFSSENDGTRFDILLKEQDG